MQKSYQQKVLVFKNTFFTLNEKRESITDDKDKIFSMESYLNIVADLQKIAGTSKNSVSSYAHPSVIKK